MQIWIILAPIPTMEGHDKLDPTMSPYCKKLIISMDNAYNVFNHLHNQCLVLIQCSIGG
jgi:hypothetical protein